MASRQMKNQVRSTSQLARTLGLSRWTVSRALNGHKGISPATVERIRQAARRHGFAPNILARGLRAGKTDLLGVCVPDLVDYFLTDKIMHLQKAAATRGLDILLQIQDGTTESERHALERFAAMRCHGVLLIAPRLCPPPRLTTPVVCIDPLIPGTGAVVETDRPAAYADVLHHLHDLGHRRIASVGIDPRGAYGSQRIKGLQHACRNLRPTPHLIHFSTLPAGEQWEEFDRNPVTALIALNDRLALRLLQWARQRGLAVPQQLSVTGYDNMEIATLADPPLTSVDPHAAELMEQAVALLDVARPTRVRVRPQLVPRQSSASPYSP